MAMKINSYYNNSFAAANYSRGMKYGSGSTVNVAIAPQFLAKMANDPELEAEYEKNIAAMQECDEEFARIQANRGWRVAAQGWAIDKDGGISGWAITTKDPNARSHLQTMSENAEKIRRQNAEKKQEQEKLGQKRNSVLKNMQEKYSNFNITSGFFSEEQMSSADRGFQGVIINPAYLSKAERDGQTAKDLDEMLSGVESAQKWLADAFRRDGLELVSGGYYIDENGNMSSWSHVRKKDSIFDGLAKQSEKSGERIEKKREKVREQKKEDEEKKAKEKSNEAGQRIDFRI